jgi:hypothetical protein
MQHTADAKPDLKALFLRLDRDIRSACLGCVINYRSQQFYYRRIFGFGCPAQRAKIDCDLSEFLLQFAGKACDLVGSAINVSMF